MSNQYESPKSMEPVVAPPPRSWQRTAFFKLNFALGLLPIQSCWFAFAISRDVPTLSVAIAVTIYVACEGVGLFILSTALERGLGIADLIIALVGSVMLVVSIANPPPNRAKDFLVFELAFALFLMGFLAYLITCGILRLKWTAKS